MKTTKIFCAFFSALWLAGCELLPEQTHARPEEAAEALECHATVPTFDEEVCLLPDWIAFGLASQRGDSTWRNAKLETLEARLAGREIELSLARAVALAWGSERQWSQAADLYRDNLHEAPAKLQPLLRYWLNELEGRRSMSGQLARARGDVAAMKQENEQLAEKLEALTAIEQNINLRQQSP
ncbi:hypothetical protein [Billgrantia endophytica]|uniref:YfhG lipoprotein n=1 Tax=Billgrantia endophytica TaxID=2033802 RepID=A0A2N7U6K8_9GAMM|nr:hypothetical protein [Halomonas endophytica]PMR76070.1 hypothetical protein C1H69_06740 [Halomonas endophytica]